jgi:acyl carrier protein
MAETVQERVIRVFADFKKVPKEEISMDTTFEELGFDSLDGLNLVFELEEEFDLTIPDNKVADMKGVRQAVEGVEALLEAKEKGIDVNAQAMEEFAAEQKSKQPVKTVDAAPAAEIETKKADKKPAAPKKRKTPPKA